MLLSTAEIEDFDRFLATFTTKGAEKRKQHGSRGATVFRDPNRADRIWVVFDWTWDGWQKFMADPEVPAIFEAAGLKSRPEMMELVGEYSS